MNTYGRTKCPSCGENNSMYRPLEELTKVWNDVECWNCGNEYKHVDESLVINNNQPKGLTK